MHFHWRTERAARGLGEVVLGFIAVAAVCLPHGRRVILANFLVIIGDAHPLRKSFGVADKPSQQCHRRRLGNRRSLPVDGALRSCLFPQPPWN
jgi:hypothetical protein